MDDYITFKDVKKITKESYRRIFKEYIEYVDKLPKPPTREDIKTYREELMERLQATSVQKHMVIIRGFYEWLYAEGKGENIAIGIKGVKITNNFKREALSVEQARRLIDHSRCISDRSIVELRNYAIIGLMLTTGLRTIEVSRADSEDILFVEDAHVLLHCYEKVGHVPPSLEVLNRV
jgi:site-specific recombinase XerD